MVSQSNLRQKSVKANDAGPAPTEAERDAWRASLRARALPDERIPGA